MLVRAIILSFLLLPAMLRAEDSLLWLLYDAPPLTIRSGDQAGQGFGELQQRFLAAHMPNFDHRVTPAALDRIWHDMGEKDGICSINLMKTPERTRLYTFSHRPMPTPGYRVMIADDRRADFAAMIGADGTIDLDTLAASQKFRGAALAALHYPEILAKFLNRPDRAGKLDIYTEPNQLFNLMQAGRIDFAIILAVELPFFNRRFPAMPYPALLPIKNVPLTNNGYVACSRGFIGQHAIQQINTVLDDDRSWAAYVALMKGWVSPSEFAIARASRPDGD